MHTAPLPGESRSDQLRILESLALHGDEAILVSRATGPHPLDYTIQFISPAFTRMTGYRLADLAGKPVRSLYPAEIPPELRDFEIPGPSTPPFRFEYPTRCKDGASLWTEISVLPILDESGRCTHVLSFRRDIEARKRIQAALEASEERLRMAFHGASIGMALAGPDGRLREVNQTLCRLTGRTAEELTGTVLAENDSSERYFTRPDGSGAWLRITASEIPSGRLLMAEDISDRKAAEAALQQAQQGSLQDLTTTRERLDRAQSAAGLAAWELDLENFALTCSGQNLALLGVNAALPLHLRQWLEAVHPDDRPKLSAAIDRVVAGETTLEVEFRAGGNTRWVLAKGGVVSDAAGRRLLAGVNLEITGRRQVEQALAESESRLSVAQAASGTGVWDWDLVSGRTSASESHWRLFGLPGAPSDPAGGAWPTLVHPEDRTAVQESLRAALAATRDWNSEFRVIWPDGTVHWLACRAMVLAGSNGKPARVIGSTIDVTEGRLARAALDDSEARFHAVFGGGVAGMMIADACGHIIAANQSFCHILGCEEAGLLGVPMLSIAHPDDRPHSQELLDRMERGEISQCAIQTRYLRGDGRTVWVRHGISALHDAAGVLTKHVVVAEDITEAVEARERLVDSEYRFRTATEHATDLIAEFDLAARRAEVFGAYQQCLHCSREEAAAMVSRWTALVDPADRRAAFAAYRRHLRTGQPLQVELRARRFDGAPLCLAVRGTVLRSPGAAPRRLIAVAADITSRKQHDAALSRLAAIVRSSDVALISVALDGRVLTWNRGAEQLFQYTWSQMQDRRLDSILPAEASRVTAALAEGRSLAIDQAAGVRGGGGTVPVAVSVSPILEAGGRPIGGSCILRNIGEQLRAERELRESEERFRRIFEHSPIGMALVAPDGLIFRVNARLCELLGYPERELVGSRFNGLTHPSDAAHEGDLMRRLRERELQNYALEKRYVRKEGLVVWGKESCTGIWSAEGAYLHSIAVVEDITDRKIAEEQLCYQARHDVLTALPNRNLLEDRLNRAIALTGSSRGLVGVFYIDLDRFKVVNDSLGHATGDMLLKEVAARLRAVVCEEDTLARAGGDEFVLIASGLRHERAAVDLAERLQESLKAPFRVRSHELFVTASIGISLYPRDGADAHTLQRNADAAMYQAKQHGRSTVRLFTPEMSQAAMERLHLETELRKALGTGQLSLVYQPQFRVDGRDLVGFEALLRWNHPTLGEIPPVRFIPIAEETGLIAPLGTWVLHEACRQIRRWNDQGRRPAKVAVNVSGAQFAMPALVGTVTEALETYQVDPRLLELEITESLILQDVENAARKMAELRALGVSIAIDDFGTGYSSLCYLQSLPIDLLKIDRFFLRPVGQQSTAVPVLQAIVTLGHSFNLRVLAEGVETAAQLDALRQVCCDQAQGFLLGVPAPPVC